MAQNNYLAAIINLVNELNSNELGYCHWKSNYHLDRSLKGLTDLDLLVDRSQVNIFKEIIFRHDIKSISSSRDHDFPAIENFLGFDKETGNLFHLHVHYKLILGEQFVKNYHLPLENWLMERIELSEGNVAIPVAEREFVILAIRSLLKYRDRDVIKDLLKIKSPGLPIEIRNELHHLLNQTTHENIVNSVASGNQILSRNFIRTFLETIETNPRGGWQLYRLREKVRKELRPYRRKSQWFASLEYYRKLLRNENSRANKSNRKKKLTAGGIGIAFIGADGAGKSTLMKEIKNWLSWKLNVINLYMGSQEPSKFTRIFRFFSRNSRKLLSVQNKLTGSEGFIYKVVLGLVKFFNNLYYLAIANDRFRRFEYGNKKTMDGVVVLYDRYPLQQIHEIMDNNPMDGPRIATRNDDNSGLVQKLANIEKNLYEQVTPPDLLFVLNVQPEVSKARKPDHDLRILEEKSKVIQAFEKGNLNVVDIDAQESFDVVLNKTKTQIWSNL